MRFFDLFSGIGGFHLGMTAAGHQCVGACEIDKYARSVYESKFKGTKIWQDATKIDPKELPDFDCLCAGFPCQAFSTSGKRLGFKESRGTLFFEIIRIAIKKRPEFLFLENVPGLLYHDKGRTFLQILVALDEIGYDVQWQSINAKYFLPQGRDRIFIIGCLRGKNRREILPIIQGTTIDNRPRYKAQEERKRFQNKVTGTIDANYHKGSGSRTTMIVEKPKLKCILGAKNTHGMRVYDPNNGLSVTLSAAGGGLGAKTGLYAIPVHLANTRCKGRRMKTHNEPTYTLDTTGKQGIFDGKRVRKLTPLECERLQGLPDNFTSELSNTQRYKCIGNSVPVPIIKMIGEKLNHAL